LTPEQRAALAELRRAGFTEIYRDDTRVIMRNETRDHTESLTWDQLGPRTARQVRDRLQHRQVRRARAAADLKRAIRTGAGRPHLTGRERDAIARLRAQEKAEQNYRFWDRLMRSTPGF